MHDVHHISIYIARRPPEVYEFASDPKNLPRWAAGLARSEVRKEGDEWVVDKAAVENDLKTLKDLLERRASP